MIAKNQDVSHGSVTFLMGPLAYSPWRFWEGKKIIYTLNGLSWSKKKWVAIKASCPNTYPIPHIFVGRTLNINNF